MSLISIPNDFGQGGANLSEGQPKLGPVLQGLDGSARDHETRIAALESAPAPSGGALTFIATHTVTGSPARITFSALDGDLDGEYYFEGHVVGGGAPIYLEPNGSIANTRVIASRLTYSGVGTPTQSMYDDATSAFASGAGSSPEYCKFRGYFQVKRQAQGQSRTARIWSESRNGSNTFMQDATVFWDDQVTQLTSLVFGSDAPTLGVGSSISLWKLSDVAGQP